MGIQLRLTAPRLGQARVEEADPEKSSLLDDSDLDDESKEHGRRSTRRFNLLTFKASDIASLIALLFIVYKVSSSYYEFPFPSKPESLPPHIIEGQKQCAIISRPPPSPKPFTSKRKTSDRYVPGTGAVWLKNATLWTGENDGQEIRKGDGVYLENGVIRHIGSEKDIRSALSLESDAEEIDLHGAWLTPGIVDMHSHLAVDPSPSLRGTEDTNSAKSPVLPWLRSLDGFNTHDLAFNLSISGGITTMLVLPGSAGNIGGQAFTFKPRTTYENTPMSMQVDPPFVIDEHKNGSWERTHAWRHIKHACGENPARFYGNTRMDSAYDFRRAYNEGRKLKEEQERWCANPASQKEPFPNNLEWEVLADVIRGNVKVNIHCYETTDLSSLARISNEFQFPIAAFHHAHETYLVPGLFEQTWGPNKPAVAIFATNARYKREAYRGSEFAPKIHAENGISVCMKSDHPVLDSRFFVFEAAQAHHYGLNFSHAMSSVTTNPAKAIGLDHRLGYVREGYDADLVVWDSFPLGVGATPKQTYIDGIPQIIKPHTLEKPESAQEVTPAGKWDKEAREAVEARGDPDLRPKKSVKSVIFQDVAAVYLPGQSATVLSEGSSVIVTDGEITCAGECATEALAGFEIINLKGGSLTPGLISVGSYVGLAEIRQEPSTWDGIAPPPPKIKNLLVHAVDGAAFGSKDELLAYRSGVTTAVAYPLSESMFAGMSYSFSTSAIHALSPNAILNPAAALHLNLEFEGPKPSRSTKIAVLRELLAGKIAEVSEVTEVMGAVAKGQLQVVVEVNKADTIAALIRLKREVAPDMRITILGGAESWLVAEDLAAERIGVIVAPARSFPKDWDSRRIMPGPPLSTHSLPAYLASRGIKVGLGIREEWEARNTRLEAAWVYTNSQGVFTKETALDLVGKNLEDLLGLSDIEGLKDEQKGWVAWEGDWAGFGGRVRAVRAEGAGSVDLL